MSQYSPAWRSGDVTLYHGDCLDVMAEMDENSVDTIVTDPPYGLEFMGKDWDHGVPGVHFWEAALHIAKPGAMLLAFGGTRTHHRLMCAIEDAGWEIRDCLMWLYGSGFPKSHDISKAIDKAAGAEREVVGRRQYERSPYKADGTRSEEMDPRWSSAKALAQAMITAPATPLAQQWDGWGTALKPAWEPIILAMAPLDGTFAQNAERWGVAGLWIEGGRISTEEDTTCKHYASIGYGGSKVPFTSGSANGRWPANLILDEEAGALLDEMSGERRSSHGGGNRRNGHSIYGIPADDGGCSQQYYDSGGASRFFYCAKASRAERTCNGEVDNRHPTVKPLALMEYLCNLTRTPTGGIILDPFMGSGSTGIAAVQTARSFIGIEIDEHYYNIAKARIEAAQAEIIQAEMAL